MKLTALMMVRNESWVLGLTLRAALLWCDEVILLDHGSTDRTPEIIDSAVLEFGGARVKSIRVDEPHWNEMDLRQRMLDAARLGGSTHIAIVDADELITSNFVCCARQFFERAKRGVDVVLPMVSTYQSLNVRRVDGNWGERSALTLGFHDNGAMFWKAGGDGYQYHNRRPQGCMEDVIRVVHDEGGVFHLQFLNTDRLKAKAAWYKCVETLRWPGRKHPRELNRMYGWTLDTNGAVCKAIPECWWDHYRPLFAHLDLAAEPWHAGEVRKMLREHGADRFSGIELYGIS